jgi:hypothetical protein
MTKVDISGMDEKLTKLIAQLHGEFRDMEPEMLGQIENYINAVTRLRKKVQSGFKTDDDLDNETAMLYFKVRQFLDSRDQRMKELKSDDIAAANKIKDNLFPFGTPNIICCVDGRVLPKLTAGLTGHAMRTAAGDITEVRPVWGEHKERLWEGELVEILKYRFLTSDVVVEMLDSHFECGAACANYAHNHSIDVGGLSHDQKHNVYTRAIVDDIKRKKIIIKALEEHVFEEYNGKKRILNIQYSFNPTTGYCFMGLEKDECLNDQRVVDHGYSHDVLRLLSAENKIVSGEDFANQFEEVFKKYYFSVNYEIAYQESTIKFWSNIEKISVECLPLIVDKLKIIFIGMNDQQEMKQRAVFMLANAYNAYLHIHNADGSHREYPYNEHDESLIVVTRSEKGPYDRARSFSVNTKSPDLAGKLSFIDGLVRGNRRAGRASKTEKVAREILFKNQEDKFIDSTIAVFFFERLHVFEDSEIENLRRVDWSELATTVDWYNMASSEFESYVDTKIRQVDKDGRGVSSVIFRKINNLRKKARYVFDPGLVINNDLIKSGRLTPIFVLSGPLRETVALFPFLIDGYKK